MSAPMLYAAGIVLTVAVCTFLTRVFPFLLFGRDREVPPSVRYLGAVLPTTVMAILIVYCLRNTSFNTAAGFLPQLIAIAVVVLLHLWRRNNLLSIFGGTAAYMLLIQLVFT